MVLRSVSPESLSSLRRAPVDPETLSAATSIVEEVRQNGESALRKYAEKWDGIEPGAPLTYGRDALEAALGNLPEAARELLEGTAERIRAFAEAQRATLAPLDVSIPGGRAGHRLLPVASVGAYAPGGRYPLPSTVLMTAIPARVAGVQTVWVASPRPSETTLAAAAVAGADGLLAIGGAQAVANLAFGVVTPAVDMVVGPGNKWVTAAKKWLVGEIGIDALAGPSELLVIADESAAPRIVAADLLAQAEHDPDATPILVSTSAQLIASVQEELQRQLEDLATAEIARAALARNGVATQVDDLDQACRIADRLAPEHLELCVNAPEEIAARLRSYGSLFIGTQSAEVLGDYGAGPNHVLPTGGSARFQAGLSVSSFLRPATWLRLDAPELIARECAQLARIEGLEAHARAAELRRDDT